MRYARHVLYALALTVLAAVVFAPQLAGQIDILNRFLQPIGTSNDNVLEINGTIEYEDKVSVVDHGETTTANGYASVTTNLSSNVSCVLTLDATTTGDDPVAVTGIWTPGSSTLEILVWKNTSGTDPTLVQSAGAHAVGYICFGAD